MMRRPRFSGREHRPGAKGQTLTEFALIAPILLLFILGTLDFGRAIYAYNAVSNAARMGVRTAIVNQNEDEVKGRAAAQATSLGIDPSVPCTSSNSVCLEFTDSTLTFGAPCPGLYGGPDNKSCVAVVTVKYTFTAITPVIGTLIGGIPISATSVQAVESNCTGAGCPIP